MRTSQTTLQKLNNTYISNVSLINYGNGYFELCLNSFGAEIFYEFEINYFYQYDFNKDGYIIPRNIFKWNRELKNYYSFDTMYHKRFYDMLQHDLVKVVINNYLDNFPFKQFDRK